MRANLVKKCLYFDADSFAALEALRDETGVPVSESVRRALAAQIAEITHKPEDFDDVAVVRRALLNGGSWTTSVDEIGTIIDGQWIDPLTNKAVAITATICSGKAFHSSASIDRNTFGVSEVLSDDELRAANKALRVAVRASRVRAVRK